MRVLPEPAQAHAANFAFLALPIPTSARFASRCPGGDKDALDDFIDMHTPSEHRRRTGALRGVDRIEAARHVHHVREALIDVEEVGTLSLKGLVKPVPTFNVAAFKASA